MALRQKYSGGVYKVYDNALGDLLTVGTSDIIFGNATQDCDVKIFVGAAGQHVVFDAGLGTVAFTGIDVSVDGDLDITVEDLLLGDDAQLEFGDASDVTCTWTGSLLQISPATDDTGSINIGNGTKDLDFKVFLGAAGQYIEANVGDVAFVVSAGVTLSVDCETDTSSGVTGSIHTDGGIGIAKALYVGTTSRLVGAVTCDAAVSVDDTTETSSGVTGSIHTDGGLGVAKKVYIGTDIIMAGGDIDMSAGATGTYDLILKDAVADALSIRRATTDMMVFNSTTPSITITPALIITGAVAIDDTTASSSSTTGSLQTDGGLGVAGAIWAGDVINAPNLTLSGAATGLDHPIDLNSITAMTGDETVDCGNVIKINRSAGAIGGTHSGIICKHYITGGAVDGTALVSGLYVNLKYEPTSENIAAEVALIYSTLYSNASDAIDYGWYTIAPTNKISALIGVSGTMTNFMEIKTDGDAGVTISSDAMTKDPDTHTEDGYITFKVEGGASYQIPFWAA